MEEFLQEFVDSRGVDLRIDVERGVLRGVKLLGYESRNGRRYSPLSLDSARELYEGARVNVNHSKGHPLAPRDYQDRLGLVRNITLNAGEGLFGDFHFNPKHVLAEQLLWDAQHAPENVGFSHNVQARTSRGAEGTLVEAILKVHSVDLVADPATTCGLFEQTATTTSAGVAKQTFDFTNLTLDDLRTNSPRLVLQLEESLSPELVRLRSRNAELEAQISLEAKRGRTARRLLAEFQSPGAEANAELVSEEFLEALLAVPDEGAMRRLVSEHARLVKSSSRSGNLSLGKPTCREQRFSDAQYEPALTAESFARAIR